MRLALLSFVTFAILAFSSCQKDNSKIDKGNMTDAELIQAIQKASNKQSIDVAELPAVSKTTLTEEFFDDYAEAAKLAPELGYEVDMRCEKGPRVGEHRQAYFDLRGRILRGDYDKGDGDKGDGDKGDGDKRFCFDFVYPVTFIMPDDTEITIDSKDDKEGWAEIKAWYQAHPDVKERPALQFPVDIKWKDGTVTTINNKEEMMEARKKCGDDKFDRKRCFRLVLPVTFDMPDGSTITIEEKEDWKLLREWYKDHPDYDKKPELQFPVDIKWYDGTVQTINNQEEMREARKKCGDDKGDKFRCFFLVYPVTYVLPDGTEVTIDSKDDKEGWMEIKDWYKEHPDVKEKPSLQYPVDIKYNDGTVVTINSKEEMIDAKKDCEDGDKG